MKIFVFLLISFAAVNAHACTHLNKIKATAKIKKGGYICESWAYAILKRTANSNLGCYKNRSGREIFIMHESNGMVCFGYARDGWIKINHSLYVEVKDLILSPKTNHQHHR